MKRVRAADADALAVRRAGGQAPLRPLRRRSSCRAPRRPSRACRRDARTPLVLYSPHGRDLLGLVEKEFERAHPEVDVRWLDMGSQEVYDRLRSEKANPQADVWYGGPDTIFARGAREGLLAAVPARRGPTRSRPTAATTAISTSASTGRRRCPSTTRRRSRRRGAARVGRPARSEVEGQDPDPRSARLRHDARGLGLHPLEVRPRDRVDRRPASRGSRRLDAQTKEYVFNPILLYEKIVRQEGLVTIWDLPDTLLERAARLAAPVRLPEERHAGDRRRGRRRRREPPPRARASAFIDFLGSKAMQRLAAEKTFRLPARTDLGEELPALGARRGARDGRPPRSTGRSSRRDGAAVDGDLGPDDPRQGGRRRRGPVRVSAARSDEVSRVGLAIRFPPRCPSFCASSRSRSASARSPSRASVSLDGRRRARSWRCSGPRAAARRRSCAWSPASRRPTRAGSSSTARTSRALPPERRRFGMVFQHYALFPHMTVGRERRLRPGGAARRGRAREIARARRRGRWRSRGTLGLRGPARDGALRRPAAARRARARARARSPACSCSTSRSRTSTRRCARRRAGSSSARSGGSASRRSS